MLDQLRQFTSDPVSDSMHHELFARLYHVMLDYHMKESVFSRVCLFIQSLPDINHNQCFM